MLFINLMQDFCAHNANKTAVVGESGGTLGWRNVYRAVWNSFIFLPGAFLIHLLEFN